MNESKNIKSWILEFVTFMLKQQKKKMSYD